MNSHIVVLLQVVSGTHGAVGAVVRDFVASGSKLGFAAALVAFREPAAVWVLATYTGKQHRAHLTIGY